MLIAALITVTSHAISAQEADDNSTKNTFKEMTQDIISFSKQVATGISEGIREARKSSSRAGGTKIAANAAELQELLDITLLRFKAGTSDNAVIAEIGFKNSNPTPVRIITTASNNDILLIDTEGYATILNPSGIPRAITVPKNAALKQTFTFNGVAAKNADHVRFWGIELKPSR